MIKKVGVVGAGTMGAALAQKFAQEDFRVILADREVQFTEKGLKNIASVLNEGVTKKVFTESQVKDILGNIQTTTDLHDLKSCDLIIEAIFENFEAKSDLFRTLNAIVNAETILATNTSSFSVNELSKVVEHPERFIGLHYFYHAAKNRLVEIVPSHETSDEILETVKAFCFQSGKDPIICKDAYGFVVNRFFVPWLNEAVRLLDEGVANIATIDSVCMEAFGIGMGPFALMNATGIPVAYHAQKTLEVFDRKSGTGQTSSSASGNFYVVAPKLKEQVDKKEQWSFDGTVSSDKENRKKISDRMMGAVFFVCSQILDEGICTAADINRGAKIGLKWKKGPIEMMRQLGEQEVARLIETITVKYHCNLPKSIGLKYWKIQYVESEKRNGAIIITINRPEDLNALNEEVIRQLDEQFSAADRDPSVKTIFLTGSGKAFVAGADIKFFIKNIKQNSIDKIESFTAYTQEVYSKIDNSSKQVVAVLNGLALGGGLELALCADLILALPKAQLAFPETGIGIYPALGGIHRCMKKVGKNLCKYLVLTGRMLNAQQAEEIGLVDKIITVEEMFALFNGSQAVPAGARTTLNNKWKAIDHFFAKNKLAEILLDSFQGNGLTPEEAKKLSATLHRKAPLAIEIADRLIEEGKGFASELAPLHRIFSTNDALLGLTSIGKTVAFEGK